MGRPAGELREPWASCSTATSGDASERQPLKFPIRGPVRWKAGPGSEVVGGESLSAPIPLPAARLGLGWSRAARWGLSFRSMPTHVCSGEWAQIPRFLPLLQAPRPGCAPGLDGVKVSASQYNLPSGSREQICSHLRAASVFPDYEGVSGALSKSRKGHIPKAKQTPSSGGSGRAGQEPRSGWGRGWPPLWAWEPTGGRVDRRARSAGEASSGTTNSFLLRLLVVEPQPGSVLPGIPCARVYGRVCERARPGLGQCCLQTKGEG